MSEPHFPPLFRGESLAGNADPMERAVQLAIAGTDPGLIVYNINKKQMSAATIFAPETPLEEALIAIPACGVGFQNALGSLAPPEVAVHLEWPGTIRINGAKSGRLAARASTSLPEEEPDWLIVELVIDLRYDGPNPGGDPDSTALFEEGCVDVEPITLLESWARHTLYWINRWQNGDVKPLHAEWRTLAYAIGEEIDWEFAKGIFLGIDEQFGALVRSGNETRLVPLSILLEH